MYQLIFTYHYSNGPMMFLSSSSVYHTYESALKDSKFIIDNLKDLNYKSMSCQVVRLYFAD